MNQMTSVFPQISWKFGNRRHERRARNRMAENLAFLVNFTQKFNNQSQVPETSKKLTKNVKTSIRIVSPQTLLQFIRIGVKKHAASNPIRVSKQHQTARNPSFLIERGTACFYSWRSE
ncbi:MAG: hypothetical protein JNN30_07740 [Rhodanobacteraceae bacterium]|nr:hypothetical protein [Rhodanobacteraceae bacterium]